ncbi:hypothetical protein [Bosea sp. ANAM02]|uniref:hypothetical protein n=1 Tax=Bosea sp. ANAM02 TaxID=2020412 RepID=UPI00140EDEE2|nr:hypothetical protein [Bosea sp. ANAM02]BCB21359.1 hypothetical protein OCUBac02_42530 [Bosea sp. ANAM02]
MSSVKRALVAYSMSSTHVQTTLDYLVAFKKFSGFETDFVHVTHNAVIDFAFDGYDIVFHSYCARLCFEGYVSDRYREKLKAFSGVKVLAVQDEYDRTDTLKAAIKDLGFDIVLTCVPQDSLDYVYPRSEFPDVTFITVFTGYVPEMLMSELPAPKPLAQRSIFIGYRGRDIGGRYGRLGFDKFEIGRRMKELCDARSIATDIAMDEASRIYGTAWFDFIGNCRAMLGSESGSNVFDFDGSIEVRFKEMTAANGGVPPSYADFLPIVVDRDGEIEMGQISPRVFECAMMRTPMVLFKGRYSDAIVPNQHYISLEKDFSNVDAVLERLKDLPSLEAMTQRAFDHLVGSGRFTYRAFYAGVAGAIEERLAQKSCGRNRQAEVPMPPTVPVYRSGMIEEPATAVPLGSKGFRLRVDAVEAAVYGREFDRLTGEFGHLRSIFEPEINRLLGNYAGMLDRLVQAAQMTIPSFFTLEDCETPRLLVDYDAEMVSASQQRKEIRAAFEAALPTGTEEASSEALRQTLQHEKDGYFHLIEWIRRLNEVYDADRLNIERAFHKRIAALGATILPGLSPKQRFSARLLLLRLRFWAARRRILRGAAHSPAMRRLLAAVPVIAPLARRVARRLRLSGLT